MTRLTRFYLISIFVMLLASVGVSLLNHIVSLPEHTTVAAAWQRMALSGSYTFETEIDQVNTLEPRLSNVGVSARRKHYKIYGSINESDQSSTVRIEDLEQTTAAYEIRQTQGQVYVRRAGQTWQKIGASNFADNATMRTASFLLGVVETTSPQTNHYEVTFSGAQYLNGLQQFAQQQQNTTRQSAQSTIVQHVAEQQQMQQATGTGTITLTPDGLPDSMRLTISLPAIGNDVAKTLTIYSTFQDYARDGLALKTLTNQPINMLAQYLNIDMRDVLFVVYGIGALWVLVALIWTIYSMGIHLRIPLALLTVSMLIFQPYSTLPRTQAAQNPAVPEISQSNTENNDPILVDLPTDYQFDPTVSPLDAAALQPGSSFQSPLAQSFDSLGLQRSVRSSVSTDTDGDGLTNDQEQLLGSNINLKDSDSDGLSDFEEHNIGTNLLSTDSDYDQLSDFIEVTVPSRYGSISLYTNPLKSDTNGDGIPDLIECPEHAITPIQACADNDGDGQPNFLDFDNDNDGVPDHIDENIIGSRGSISQPLSRSNPFSYQLTLHKDTGVRKYVEVNMQFRLADAAYMYSHQAIYDWPNNDTSGQVQRTNNTTFKDLPNSAGLNDNFARGDLSLNGTVMVEVPITGGDWGNLPVTEQCKANPATATCAQGDTLPAWLDTAVLSTYGISANYASKRDGSVDKDIIQITTPVYPIYDTSNTLVAYKSKIIYQVNKPTIVPGTNTIEPVWTISGIISTCPDNTNTCAAKTRVDKITALHSYHPDWILTGMTATEHIETTLAYVVEDATKKSVSEPNVRRKAIIRVHQFLEGAFIDTHSLSIDSTIPAQSIVKLLNNTSSTAALAKIYGIETDAFRVYTNKYYTQPDITMATVNQENHLTNLVGGNKKFSTYAAGCVAQPMAISCTPAMITLTESRTRSAQFTDTKSASGALSLANSDVTVDRSMIGEIYTPVYNTQNPTEIAWDGIGLEAYDAEVDLIRPYITPKDTVSIDNIPSDLWGVLRMQTFVSSIGNFLTTTSSTVAEIKDMRTFQTLPNDSWQSQITQFITANSAYYIKLAQIMTKGIFADVSQETIYSQIIKDALNAPKQLYGSNVLINIGTIAWSGRSIIPEMQYPGLQLINQMNTGVSSTQSTADEYKRVLKGVIRLGLSITTIKDWYQERKIYNLAVKSNIAGFAEAVSTARKWAYSKKFNPSGVLGAGFDEMLSIALKQSADKGLMTERAFDDANKIISNAKGAKAATAATDLVGGVSKIAKAVAKLKSAVRVLGKAGDVLAVGLVIYEGINNISDAKYNFQVGNAVGDMIGDLAATVFLIALSSSGIGAVIAAVIGALDFGISELCDAYVSKKDQRETGYKLLCGGFTGLLSNLFNPYSTYPIVDISDEYSRSYSVTESSGMLVDVTQGYSVGNSFQTSLQLTDYVEKMPFPADWKSAMFFWQWLNADVEDTSVAYELSPQKNDISYTIGEGTQRAQWKSTNEKPDFSYKKIARVNSTSEFKAAGINQKMSDLYLTQAFVTPQQTCFGIFFFYVPLAVCYMDTFDDIQYTNISEDDPTYFDIFPQTFTEFMTFSRTSSQFRFAWNTSTTASFPALVDADNDGLTALVEARLGTDDSKWDTDSDGIVDSSENDLGSNPLLVDADLDGLTDPEEFRYGTNPNAVDSDGDGLTDGEEIVRVKDGQRVGGWEVYYALGKFTWVGSDPLSGDGDSDGIIDSRERTLGWSPTAYNNDQVLSIASTTSEAYVPAHNYPFGDDTAMPTVNAGATRVVDTAPVCTLTGCTLGMPPTQVLQANQVTLTNIPYQYLSEFTFGFWIKPAYVNRNLDIVIANGAINIRLNMWNLVLEVNGVSTGLLFPSPKWNYLSITRNGRILNIEIIAGESSDNQYVQKSIVLTDNLLNTLDAFRSVSSATITSSNMRIDDIRWFRKALTTAETRQLLHGTLDLTNDNMVAPGNNLLVTTNVKNNLLGRTIHANTELRIPGYGASMGDTTDTESVQLAPNAANVAYQTAHIPGNRTIVNGTTTFVAGCAYPTALLCVPFDTATTVGNTLTFKDWSAHNHTIATSIDAGPQQRTNTYWEFNNNKQNLQLRLPNDVVMPLLQDNFTISLWVNPRNQQVTQRPLVHPVAALNNDYPTMTVGGITLTATTTIPLNTWTHLTFRLVNRTMQIFIDGVLNASSTKAVPVSGATGTYAIGSNLNGVAAQSWLANLEIYGSALDSKRILAIANHCTDDALIACYPFNETSGMSKLANIVSQGYIQNDPLNCDSITCMSSTSQAVRISHAYFPRGTAAHLLQHEFTVMAAFTLNSPMGDSFILASPSAGDQVKIFVSHGTNIPTFRIKDTVLTMPNTTLAVGTPYMLTARYISNSTGTNTMVLSLSRVSGSTILTTHTNATTVADLTNIADPLRLGNDLGTIFDDVRVYHDAVDDAHIDNMAQILLRQQVNRFANSSPQTHNVNIEAETQGQVINTFDTAKPCNYADPTALLCASFNDYETIQTDARSSAVAEQSSESSGGKASRSIDRNDNSYSFQNWQSGSINHTSNIGGYQWWQMDMNGYREIASVEIDNRVDCCSTRLNNARLLLSDSSFGTGQVGNPADVTAKFNKNIICNSDIWNCAISASANHTVKVWPPVTARYLRIQQTTTEPLHVAEVRAYGRILPCYATGAQSQNPNDTCPIMGNQGMQFDGSKYLRLNNVISEKFTGTQTFTIMTWVKVAPGYTGNSSIGIPIIRDVDTVSANKTMRFGFKGTNNSQLCYSTGTSEICGSTVISSGWNHVALVRSSTATSLYLNGKLLTSGANYVLSEATNLYIGAGLKGTLNNLQIYSQALSQESINNTMHLNAPVIDFTFDESAMSTIFTNTDNTIKLMSVCKDNSCPIAGQSGKFLRSVYFNGKNSLYGIITNLTSSLETAQHYSVGVWVKPKRWGGSILGQMGAINTPFDIELNPDGTIDFAVVNAIADNSNKATHHTDVKLPLNEWSYVGFSVNQGVPTFYVNTPQQAYTGTAFSYRNTGPISQFLVGKGFVGNIDNLTIDAFGGFTLERPRAALAYSFSDVLRASATTTPTITAFVPQTQSLGHTSVHTPMQYLATCTGTPFQCPNNAEMGYIGNAVTFNGTTDGLVVKNAFAVNSNVLSAPKSIEFFVRPEQFTQTNPIIVAQGDPNNLSTTDWRITIANKRINVVSAGRTTLVSTTDLALGWNHIVVSYENTNMVIYKNGYRDTSINTTSNYFTGSANTDLIIGAKFAGAIDELSFTNAPLLTSDILRTSIIQSAYTSSETTTNFTVDADVPSIALVHNPYVSRLPQVFLATANDSTSTVTKLTSTITAPDGTQRITTNVPACVDSLSLGNYCPTFAVSQDTSVNVEGQYAVAITATDSVGNQASKSSIITVDTTPPTAVLSRDTSVYSTTQEFYPVIHVKGSITDPVIGNTSPAVSGSGVKSLELYVQDIGGRSGITEIVAATVNGSAWTADLKLRYQKASGLYHLYARTTDTVGNVSPFFRLTDSTPIQVDNIAPNDTTDLESPTLKAPVVGKTEIRGIVSDRSDSRPALQTAITVRLDFETDVASSIFVNRADYPARITCTTCPNIVNDTSITSRVAQFNIGAIKNQTLNIRNVNMLFQHNFSMVMRVKIASSGTIVSVGTSSTPRLRIQAEASGSAFALKVTNGINILRNTKSLLRPNTWYTVIYSESKGIMSLSHGETLDALNTVTLPINSPITTTADTATLGAITSNTDTLEDFITGYIDDVIIFNTAIPTNSLKTLNETIAGSGVNWHAVRFNTQPSIITEGDTISTKLAAFYPINQASYPLINVINGKRTSVCATIPPQQAHLCPDFISGFTSNALVLQTPSDGGYLDYPLHANTDHSATFAFRTFVSKRSTTGNIISLESTAPNTNSSAWQVVYDAEKQQFIAIVTAQDASQQFAIHDVQASDAGDWYTLAVSLEPNTVDPTKTDFTWYIDGRPHRLTRTALVDMNRTTIHIGSDTAAIIDITSPIAATNTYIDDIAYFHTPLTRAEMVYFSVGMQPVFQEDFFESSYIDKQIANPQSPYTLPVQYNTGSTINTAPGLAGSYSIALTENDTLSIVDKRGLTFSAATEPWGLSVWVDSTDQNGSIITGQAQDYRYALTIEAGKLVFSMAGARLDGPTAPSSPYHVVITSDGANISMYVNGARVANRSVGTIALPQIPMRAMPTFAVQFPPYVTASAAFDDNPTTCSLIDPSSFGYIYLELPPDVLIDDVEIVKCDVKEFNVNMMDMNNLRIYQITNGNFSITTKNTADKKIVVPINGMLQTFYVLNTKPSGVTGYNEIRALTYPKVVIGSAFTGALDSIQVFRRSLNAGDIGQLYAQGWQATTRTVTTDGYTWSTNLPDNIEATVDMFTTATDNAGNIRTTGDENALWGGEIDTYAPRVTQQFVPAAMTGTYTYTIRIDDQNLDLASIQTPCGEHLRYTLSAPESILNYTYNQIYAGAVRKRTHFEGTCQLSTTPTLTTLTETPLDHTRVAVNGKRMQYVGGVNEVFVYDSFNAIQPIVSRVPVAGTVTHLLTSADQNTLFVLSKAPTSTTTTLSIFDISLQLYAPTLLSTLNVVLANTTSVAAVALTNHDANLFVLTTGASNQLIRISVGSRKNPTTAERYTNNGGVDITAIGNILSVANGAYGISIYTVSEFGELQFVRRYDTPGYANRIFSDNRRLYILDDEEPIVDGVLPQSVNRLRLLPLVVVDSDGVPVLDGDGYPSIQSQLTESFEYFHIIPSNQEFEALRINAVQMHGANEVFLLSSGTNTQRLSLLDITTSPPALRTETSFSRTVNDTVTTMLPIGNNIIGLGMRDSTSTLSRFTLADIQASTRICDLVANCTTLSGVAPSSAMQADDIKAIDLISSTSQLTSLPATVTWNPITRTGRSTNTLNWSRTLTITDHVDIFNMRKGYTTTQADFLVRADSTAGIKYITLFIDDTAVVSHTVTAVNSLEHRFTAVPLPVGMHTVRASMTDINDQVTKTTAREIAVDQAPPTIIIPTSISRNALINDFAVVPVTITEDTRLLTSQFRLKAEAPPLISELTPTATGYTGVIYVPYRAFEAKQITILSTVVDIVGNTVTNTHSLVIDVDPPVIAQPAFQIVAGKTTISLPNNSVITPSITINPILGWSSIIDQSSIQELQVKYAIETINSTTTYTQTLPVNALKSNPLTGVEASRMTASILAVDVQQNASQTVVGNLYFDSQLTPDYTPIAPTEAVYHGWMDQGCAVLGSSTNNDYNTSTQQFASTWDSSSVRFNWQGANWDNDGDLFIYIDSVAGGTVEAFRPIKYTRTITDYVASGIDIVTLPSDFASRSQVSTSANMYQTLNTKRNTLIRSQLATSTATVQGADYVIYIPSTDHAELWQWDANSASWRQSVAIPDYRFTQENGKLHTDVRISKTALAYASGTPFGVMAFATTEEYLLPWRTFPVANPTNYAMDGKRIQITSLINGYGWSNLNDGVCPSKRVKTPDGTLVTASIGSTPTGINTNAIIDGFGNTDADAIANAIKQSAEVCNLLPNENWCRSVEYFQRTGTAGTDLLSGLIMDANTQNTPYLGNDSVLTYTFTIANNQPQSTKPLYAIVETYGPVWLTAANTASNLPIAIIDGGIYDYHTVVDSDIRDYLVLKIAPLASNSSRTIELPAIIDSNKAQSSISDWIQTGSVAKVEVRITDEIPNNNTTGRTIEWLNNAVRIDASAPTNVVPDNHPTVGFGQVTITGSINDASPVIATQMQYTNSSTGSVKNATCTMTTDTRWRCIAQASPGSEVFSYRVRASDVYGQLNAWSQWYVAYTDNNKPTFVFDTATQAYFSGRPYGGSDITFSGSVSDTSSLASIIVCDYSTDDCDTARNTNAVASTIFFTATNTDATFVEDEHMCSMLPIEEYYTLPIVISGDPRSRVSTLTVEVSADHLAAAELNLKLRSPNNTIIDLMRNAQNTSTNLRALFTDSTNTVAADLTGVYSDTFVLVNPVTPLSTLTNESINGTWSLLACDRFMNGNSGRINSVKLNITATTPEASANEWMYQVNNQTGLDFVPRDFLVRARDDAGNTSGSQVKQIIIDNVAPQVIITQQQHIVLPSPSTTLFTGISTDGGQISTINAVLSKYGTRLNSYAITPNLVTGLSCANTQQVGLQCLDRQVVHTYTWDWNVDTKDLTPGDYTVQFQIQDSAGNVYTTQAYAFIMPNRSAPTVHNVQKYADDADAKTQLSYVIDTGAAITNLQIGVSLNFSDTVDISGNEFGFYHPTRSVDTPIDGTRFDSGTDMQTMSVKDLHVYPDGVIALSHTGVVTTRYDNNTAPLVLAGLPTNIRAISLADYVTSADLRLLSLSTDGVVYESTSITTTMLITNTNIIDIAAGRTHNLALINTGRVIAWGSNSDGQATVPPEAQFNIVQVAAGDNTSYAPTNTGRVIAWGNNSDNATTVPVAALSQVIFIAAGYRHAIALKNDGSVVMWGKGSTSAYAEDMLLELATLDTVFVNAGANGSVAVTSNGKLHYWDSDGYKIAPVDYSSHVAINAGIVAVLRANTTTSVAFQLNAETIPTVRKIAIADIIPGRRYKYTITASNSVGSSVYSDEMTSQLQYDTVYLPFISK